MPKLSENEYRLLQEQRHIGMAIDVTSVETASRHMALAQRYADYCRPIPSVFASEVGAVVDRSDERVRVQRG